MPIHDWTKVQANRFHDFHQNWISTIRNVLNAGLLPEGYFALAEQRVGGPAPDVIALSVPTAPNFGSDQGIALAEAPVKTWHMTQADATRYAQKADRIKIHSDDGVVIAVIEIMSPGNKDSGQAIKSFIRKSVEFLHAGVHLLIVDLFPPSRRDPEGIHHAIWQRIRDEEYSQPKAKPLTIVSYSAGSSIKAYVEPVAVGLPLPDMPIFLAPNHYIPCPLESTYNSCWELFPKVLKGPLLS